MHVFLAGATGVIGRRVVPLLVASGHQVTALSRTPAGAEELQARGAAAVVGDALDAESVHAAVTSARPDVVMNQVTDLATGSSGSNAALRVTTSRNLVDAALVAGARRVISQSIAWAYAPGERPAVEAEPLDMSAVGPRQTTVSGISALEAATAEAPEWVVLRYGMLYGPDTWFAPDGLRAFEAREGRLALDSGVTSFLHVDDAAAAAVAALGWPSGPVNVCDDEPVAGLDWVPAFSRAVGAAGAAAGTTPGRPQVWARGADNTYARTALGLRLQHPTWREGFASMATG